MARSEMDKLAQSPVVVVLGGKEYEVKLLTIKKAREWRHKVLGAYAAIQDTMKTVMEDEQATQTAMGMMFQSMPDETIDLFFAYAQDLDREEIEDTANEFELEAAWEEVVKVGFPLSSGLVVLVEAMNTPAREKPTSSSSPSGMSPPTTS